MSAEQPTVLPWHREAAKEINRIHECGDWSAEVNPDTRIAQELARHDERRTDSPALRLLKNQHATTLRLLEEAVELLEEHALSAYEDLAREIRAHLAAQGGGK